MAYSKGFVAYYWRFGGLLRRDWGLTQKGFWLTIKGLGA